MTQTDTSKQKNKPQTQLNTEMGADDFFRQNASFDEKNLQNERLFSTLNVEHDIRTIDRKKVENMIVTADVQSIETPQEFITIGKKGIVEWIWKNKVMTDIPSTFLKSYLHGKKKIDAMNFYRHYKLVSELSQQVAIFRQIPIEEVSDVEIFDEPTLEFLQETFSENIQKKKLVTTLYKKAQQIIPQDHVSINSLGNRSDRKAKYKNLHPKVIEFLTWMEQEGKAVGTQRNFLRHMNMLLPWLSQNLEDLKCYVTHTIPILRIKEMHLQEFRSYLLKKVKHGEYARVTVAECLYSVIQFFQFLNKKYGFPNPASKLKSIKAPRYKYRDLPTNEQITYFLKVINQYSDHPALERAAFRLMFSLGLRSIEVARLSWNDINLGIKTIRIHGKGNRYDFLPLVGQLYEDLKMIDQQSQNPSMYLLGNSINKNLKSLQDNYKLYCLIAGWEFKGALHLFRHLFITNLSKQNVLPQALKELSRVERLDTVSLYTHINHQSTWLNKEINKLNYTKEVN
ncbi:tyrosine-type recombinase/integrase [Paenibacillus sp. V4I5]|uniref:tyrosine-type recombinase/integrase n=1 Tax=Paenibacillus sp. V4I5 TaxID=3042306 RepID=UPI00278D96DE|nr:tyrosine-type recombinase/integrase [Paenibacillus sp. V4I5]MDQ0917549.1 site-specific recombinase XerD [Paenibacillus sp. V4I5]